MSKRRQVSFGDYNLSRVQPDGGREPWWRQGLMEVYVRFPDCPAAFLASDVVLSMLYGAHTQERWDFEPL